MMIMNDDANLLLEELEHNRFKILWNKWSTMTRTTSGIPHLSGKVQTIGTMRRKATRQRATSARTGGEEAEPIQSIIKKLPVVRPCADSKVTGWFRRRGHGPWTLNRKEL